MTTPEHDAARKRAIERIKKCLSLSKSPEPHEAATALAHAQKLMSHWGVDEAELTASRAHDEVVKTREVFGANMFIGVLIHVIEQAFGVKGIMEQNPGTARRTNIRFFGPEGRVLLAVYSAHVVEKAAWDAWYQYLADHPWVKTQPGSRQSFRLAWLYSVQSKIQALAPSSVEQRAIDLRVEQLYPVLGKVKPKAGNVDYSAARAGHRAGDDFHLHAPVKQSPLSLEHAKKAQPDKIWAGSTPKQCDICEEDIRDEFTDGKTKQGPWAIMCPRCLARHGLGLGLGLGQKYQKRDDGKFRKIEG